VGEACGKGYRESRALMKPRVICADYDKFDAQPERVRVGVFDQAAATLGTVSAISEKDYWVCRTIDFLFKGLGRRPKLTFRGGTSLSKGYGLIKRFSEDIDIVVSLDGIYDRVTPNPFRRHVPRNRLREVMPGVIARAESYVHGKLKPELEQHFGPRGCTIQALPTTTASISLALKYPAICPLADALLDHVLLQFCVKADTEPHSYVSLRPYVADEIVGDWNFTTADVCMLRPSRTFGEKLFAMHGAATTFARDSSKIGQRNRLSRHYYDVAMMYETPHAERGAAPSMLAKVYKNQETRWGQKAWLLEDAKPGSMIINPPSGRFRELLKIDYAGMQSMMFGAVKPLTFEEVMERVAHVDDLVNKRLV
jgi:hypothetical protein